MKKKINKNNLEKTYGKDLADVICELGVFKTAKNEEDLYNKLYKDVYENPKPNKKIVKKMKNFFKGVEKIDIKIDDWQDEHK